LYPKGFYGLTAGGISSTYGEEVVLPEAIFFDERFNEGCLPLFNLFATDGGGEAKLTDDHLRPDIAKMCFAAIRHRVNTQQGAVPED
jgi:hypothetical protein